MAREFNVSTGGATVTGSTTLVFVNPKAAANFNIEFLRWWVGQTANATSAQQRIQINSQVTSFPTLTAATPASLKRADPNASVIVGSTNGFAGTAGVNSSNDNAGAQTQISDDAFNVLNGWLSVPTPPETIVAPAGSSSGIGMKFPVAPSTLTNWAMGSVFREV
jgi:hypothetical protein